MSRRESGALRRPAHSAASRFPLPLVVNPRECGKIVKAVGVKID